MTETLKTVVVERSENTDKQVAKTVLVLMPPWKVVAVRATRVYLMALVGLLGAAGVGVTTAVGVSMSAAVTMLQAIGACLVLAVGPALVSAAWNTYELLKKWDETSPQLRA